MFVRGRKWTSEKKKKKPCGCWAMVIKHSEYCNIKIFVTNINRNQRFCVGVKYWKIVLRTQGWGNRMTFIKHLHGLHMVPESSKLYRCIIEWYRYLDIYERAWDVHSISRPSLRVMVGKSMVLPAKDCGLECYLEKCGVCSIGMEEVWMRIPSVGIDAEFTLWEFVLWEWSVTGTFGSSQQLYQSCILKRLFWQ